MINLKEQFSLWHDAVVRIMDIRHIIMEFEECLKDYRVPVSAFIYATRGSARIKLDGQFNHVRKFHVLHCGKGAWLDIEANHDFEYFLILYKGTIPQYGQLTGCNQTTAHELFQLQYNFIPQYPAELLHTVNKMHQVWQRDEPRKLQVKMLFYQFIHELLWQMEQQGDGANTPGLSEQVIRYMEQHYHEAITLESLSEIMRYSPQYLSRRFKSQTDHSPIDYLIHIRMDKARELLLSTEATLQEISASVGYPDMFYFNRMFKKVTGVAPGTYRKRMRTEGHVRYCTNKSAKSSIEDAMAQRYIIDDNENHYQYRSRGDLFVQRKLRMLVAMTLLLCFTLLLGACSTSGGAQSNNTTNAEQKELSRGTDAQTPSTASEAGGTKTVSTPFGDIEIPVNPQRIIAVDYLATIVALGKQPVGSTEWIMQNPYIQGKINGVENIGDSLSLEKMLSLKPDLIVTLSTKQEDYDKYSKIAPTVSVPYNKFNNVHEEITYFGELLGLQDEASSWLKDYDKRIAEAKAKVNAIIPAGATFTVLEDQEKSLYAFGRISGRGGRVVYQALGQQAPSGINDEIMKEKYSSVSLEKLPDYVGDYLILTSSKSLDTYRADPIWGKLEAIKKDHVFIWNEERSWFGDPLAMLSQTEEIAAWLMNLPKS